MNTYSIVSTPDAQNLRGQLEQHLQRYEQMKQTNFFDKENDIEKKPQDKMIRIETILNELKQKKNFNSNKLLLNEQSSKYFGTDRGLQNNNPQTQSVKQQIPSFVINSNRKKLFFTDGTLNSTQQQSNIFQSNVYGDLAQKSNDIAQDGVLFSFQFNKGYFEQPNQLNQLKSVESKSILMCEERVSSRSSTTNKNHHGREHTHSQFGENKQHSSNKENCNSNNKVRETPFKPSKLQSKEEILQQKKSLKKFMDDQSKRSFIKLSSIYDFSKQQQVNIPKNSFSIYKKCGSSGDVQNQFDQRDYLYLKSHSSKPSENQLKKYLSENQKSSQKRKEPQRLNKNEQTYSQIFDQKKQRQLSWMK